MQQQSSRYRNVYYNTQRLLEKESLEKISCNTCESNSYVFVYEWLNNTKGLLGFGCDTNGIARHLNVNIQPGLFVLTNELQENVLTNVCALLGYSTVDVYRQWQYHCNNYRITEWLRHPGVDSIPCYLAKIYTRSVEDANNLHRILSREEHSYRYACIPYFWDAGKQVAFELLVRGCPENGYTTPRVTMRWFDANLNDLIDNNPPQIPVITFDIETVSSDPHRVPRGDHIDDILFTVSVHHTHTNVLYTLAYVPLKEENRDTDLLKHTLVERDGYPTKYNEVKETVLEFFYDERDLLIRTMQLLTLPKNILHFLVGYNSLNYDIKYLLVRCAFFGLTDMIERFVYRCGYSYGCNQIHIDLFRIIILQYNFEKYSLDHVSQQILKDSKTGISAVALRYTFHNIADTQTVPPQGESIRTCPSLRDTLHYNNYDTLLVSKLLTKCDSIDFWVSRAHECRISLSSLAINYNKMRYKLWNECMIKGLDSGYFLTKFKTSRLPILVPCDQQTYEFEIMIDSLLNGGNKGESGKKKFPGGANFCLGTYAVENVQNYDYRIAYPLLIERANISDETCVIIPANVLLSLTLGNQISADMRAQCRTYDYMTHSGETQAETNILYSQYIEHGMYCGGEFPFKDEELVKRATQPVVLIRIHFGDDSKRRCGVLSKIVARFNSEREQAKQRSKRIKTVIDTLEEDIAGLRAIMKARKHQEKEFGHNSTAEGSNLIVDNDDNDDDEFGRVTATVGANAEDDDNEFGCVPATVKSSVNDDEFGYDSDTIGPGVNGDGGGFGCVSTSEPVSGGNGKFGYVTDQTSSAGNHQAPKNDKAENGLYKFSNRYLCVGDSVDYRLDIDCLLSECEDPLAELEHVKECALSEAEKEESTYQLRKSIVCSIYGCLEPEYAAIITSMIRTFLLKSAQYVVRKGYNVYYTDTDSLFITHPCRKLEYDLSSELNKEFPFTEIAMKKIDLCMFVRKKTYYKIEDGLIKYGQHARGPPAWRCFVEYTFAQNWIRKNDDVLLMFEKFFTDTYARLKTLDLSAWSNEVSQPINLRSSYVGRTPAAKYKTYLTQHYPALAGTSHHIVYYTNEECFIKTVFRPSFTLHSDSLSDVNLYKYYSNVFQTVSNIIRFHVMRNSRPHTVTMSDKFLDLAFLRAYVVVHEKTFK